MSQTVLITGASSGIGKATALTFQKYTWNVAATMRSPEKEKELGQYDNIRCFRLDVTDPASIQEAIAATLKQFGSIDAVVNNAGYGLVGPFEGYSPEQLKKQFDTNVFGLMNVCQEIIPYFRKRGQGVIVNVASIGGRVTFPLYSAYHATKWAVEGFSESLQFELRPFNIRVKIIEPGAINTDFYHRSAEVVPKTEELKAYNDFVSKALPNMKRAGAQGIGPEKVAETIYKAVIDYSWKMRYAVGSDAKILLFLRRFIPDSLWQMIVSARLLK